MFEVISYWMWAASLVVLALVCGAALSPQERRVPRELLTRHAGALRLGWEMR
jgi:uncharacterized membrane protein